MWHIFSSLSFYLYPSSSVLLSLSLSIYKLRIISKGMTRNFSPGQSRRQWRIMDILSTKERREKEGCRTVGDGDLPWYKFALYFSRWNQLVLPRPHNRHKLRKNTATYKLRRNRCARRQVRDSPGSNLSESLSRSSVTASSLSLYRIRIQQMSL